MTIRIKKLGGALSVLLLSASAATAAPINGLADLHAVRIWEQSSAVADLFNIQKGVNFGLVTTRLSGRLSATNSDYQSAANEYYDFFFSDADGNFDLNGAFLTIEAMFDNPNDAGLNIAKADLVFTGGTTDIANSVASYVSLGYTGSLVLHRALDDDLTTSSLLGFTDPASDQRLRLTLGFASTAPAVIPLPAALPSLLGALLTFFWLGRQRRRPA